MLINVIHGGRTERMALLEKEIEGQGLSMFFDVEVWQGVHDSRSVVRSINLSHKQIVRNAKENGYPEVTIAEDDVKFCGKGAIKYYLDNKSTDYDLYLGCVYLGDIQPDNTVDEFSALIFYTVHERFYDTFLSVSDDLHIDRALTRLGKFVVCNPMCCKQHDNIFSSNTGKIEDYSHQLRNYKFLQ